MNLKLALLAAAVAFVPTFAQAGTVQFNGEIINSTCAPSGGSGDLAPVTFGPIDAGSLSNAGDIAGHQEMNIKLTCSSALGRKVAVQFGSTTLVDPETGNLMLDTASTAGNVQIAVFNDADEKQVFNATPTASSWKDTAAGDVPLVYRAAYVANGGAATVGTANSLATFTVVYQ